MKIKIKIFICIRFFANYSLPCIRRGACGRNRRPGISEFTASWRHKQREKCWRNSLHGATWGGVRARTRFFLFLAMSKYSMCDGCNSIFFFALVFLETKSLWIVDSIAWSQVPSLYFVSVFSFGLVWNESSTIVRRIVLFSSMTTFAGHRRRMTANKSHPAIAGAFRLFPMSVSLSATHTHTLGRRAWAEIHIHYVVPWVDKPLSTLVALQIFAKLAKSPPPSPPTHCAAANLFCVFVLQATGFRLYTIMDYERINCSRCCCSSEARVKWKSRENWISRRQNRAGECEATNMRPEGETSGKLPLFHFFAAATP